MKNRSSALLMAALLVLALAACSTPAEPSETADPSQRRADRVSGGARVRGSGVRGGGSGRGPRAHRWLRLRPEEITVPVGTEVVFLNADGFAHTVTEGTDGQAVDDPIVDEEIAQNGTVSVTFDEAGTYDITCEIHPSMQMTVTVEG